jgi:hypothetical protein
MATIAPVCRSRGVWFACCLCGLLTGAPPAVAHRSVRTDEQLAGALVRIIRQDAHQRARRAKRFVTVTRFCCGRRTLHVHYGVARTPHVLDDAYLLRLDTAHGRVETIAISESLTEEEHTTGIVKRESSFEYKLARLPGRPGFGFVISFSAGGSIDNPPGQPSMGSSSRTECHPLIQAPRALYREMLVILSDARHHASSVANVNPRRYC